MLFPLWPLILSTYDFYVPFLTIYNFVFMSCTISMLLNFHVSHLNYEKFNLCLQNTLNMLKTTRVYFGALHRMTAIKAKLDAVMNKMGNNEKRMHIAYEVGAVKEGMRNSAEGHVEEEPYQIEEAQYLNANRSYIFKPNPNLPTHYAPALRNHESFSYGGGAQ